MRSKISSDWLPSYIKATTGFRNIPNGQHSYDDIVGNCVGMFYMHELKITRRWQQQWKLSISFRFLLRHYDFFFFFYAFSTVLVSLFSIASLSFLCLRFSFLTLNLPVSIHIIAFFLLVSFSYFLPIS